MSSRCSEEREKGELGDRTGRDEVLGAEQDPFAQPENPYYL